MKKNKILGISLIIIAIIILSYPIIDNHQAKVTAKASVINYLSKTSTDNEKNISVVQEVNSKYDYIAILEIPKISLRKGLVAIDNEYNDIAYNVSILPPSDMPDRINGNLILAAHNGNSEVSYFKDLELLNQDDEVIVYFNSTKYIYKIANSYVIEKTGKANIVRDKAQNTITLITCKNGSDTEQIIFIGYLIDKETY